MEKCSCWEEKDKLVGWYGGEPIYKTIYICNGTKEREECNCNGEVTKCNFYPEKREKHEIIDTITMIKRAQKDGYCYETTNNNNKPILYYQKIIGVFDENQNFYNPKEFDSLMDRKWQLPTMTKSEAEAKFNIKIVGD